MLERRWENKTAVEKEEREIYREKQRRRERTARFTERNNEGGRGKRDLQGETKKERAQGQKSK